MARFTVDWFVIYKVCKMVDSIYMWSLEHPLVLVFVLFCFYLLIVVFFMFKVKM